jgi:hypothetical protein
MLDITVRPERPNRALRLKPIGLKTVRAGETLRFSASIEDAAYWRSRGNIEYRCDSARRLELSGPMLDRATGTFTWVTSLHQRPGSYGFTMSVSGPQHASGERDFTVRVLRPATPAAQASHSFR